jgi:MFS family permease
MTESGTSGHPRRWLILAILNLSLVLIVASVSSLNVAIPSIQRQLDATAAELVWINAAYALVFAGLLLPAGALGDRFGRRGALQTGLVVFIAGALLATISDDPVQLVFLRGAMGIGAALIMPATLSIITVVFPPAERAKAIAIW